MVAKNALWNSRPRAKQGQADNQRKERAADESLIRAAKGYDRKAIADEMKKYDSNISNIKALAILLK